MEVHDSYESLPCVIRGQILFRKDTARFEMNAGGYMYGFAKDASYTFAYPKSKPDFRKIFNIR